MSYWTDERSDLAKKLWMVDGYSASQIAKKLGGGISRNAVIGRLCRLGLTGAGPNARKAPSDPAAKRTSRNTPTRVYNRAPALKIAGRGTVFEDAEARPARVVIPFRDEPPGCCTVLTLGAHMCKWPIGDPQRPDFTFCGEHAEEGPYCLPHTARAIQPLASNRPRTGNELQRSLRRYL